LHRVRAEFAEGRAALEHSLRMRQEIGDRREIGLTLGNLGMLTAAEGDLAQGLALLRQALAGFRETEDAPGRVAATLTIASLHAAARDYEAARRMLPEALSESRHIPGNHRATAWGFVMLGDVYRDLGQPDQAAPAMAEARKLFRALGSGKVAVKRG
jgi:tetratricopeptide (TPR) repeat protein